MELIIGMIALLVVALIWSVSSSRLAVYTLKRNHLASLIRLEEQVKVSLPPLAGELVSAAINEEMDGVV
jgi:hypothetical protein